MNGDFRSLKFICPRCSAALPYWTSGSQTCPACQAEYTIRDNIYHFLLPERQREIAPFLAQYRTVREKDGYRPPTAAYYQALPEVNRRNPQADTWRVRRASFENLKRLLWRGLSSPRVPGRLESLPLRLSILDLGAGNGWLSNRLSGMGHHCVAVDWLDDEQDGLGARRFYSTDFLCAQADYDQLPFAPAQFDAVIFNASLHYADDVAASLARARRMLAPGGLLAIMDSPTFRSERAGRRMVAEMEERFVTKYGLARLAKQGAGYLTPQALGAGWRFIPSRGDAGWEARRILAAVKNRRESALFGVWVYLNRFD
ncbi:MAG: class I SAM-dependent methyltransferase [Chloroflexota bacterium]